MRKIIEYYTVSASRSDVLDDDVNEKIKEGFQPFGAPLMIPNPDDECYDYLQAMVKYEPEK